MYSRYIRQVSIIFDTCPDAFTSAELKIYLLSLVESTTEQYHTVTESAAQFLWRVIQHVLSKGFRRARDYGFLHGNAKRTLQRIQLMLKVMLASPTLRHKVALC